MPAESDAEPKAVRESPRFPVACGALGRYELERVGAVANALGPEMATVHRDATSVLLLDRSPLTWSHSVARGFAWSEGVTRPGRVACWQEAACRWGACGLVVEADRRYLHTSVAGVARVYYLRDGDAIYFASRIDALVQGTRSALSVDWDGWAAIFYLGFPLGDHTPFSEVRRLEPYRVLEAGRDGAAQVRVPRWPWAEVEPKLTVGEGAERIAQSARSAVRAVRGDRLLSTLSGGWDSRFLLSLLQEERPTRVARAYTLALHTQDAELARPVAAALRVPHSIVDPAADERFPEDFVQSALRMDYEWVPRGYLVPLAMRLRSETGVVIDGLALDQLFRESTAGQQRLGWPTHSSKRAFRRQKASRPGAYVARRLRKLYARPGKEKAVLSPPLAEAMASSLRRQLRAAAALWHDHPAQATLTLYRTRIVRGISLTPTGVFGHELAIAMPGIDHELATALLSVAPTEKLDGRLYNAVFALINPTVGALPSTHDKRRARPPASWVGPLRSAPARRLLAWGALHGPLRRYLPAEAVEGLTAGGHDPGLRLGNHFLAAMTLFTLWHERYRARLGQIDLPVR